LRLMRTGRRAGGGERVNLWYLGTTGKSIGENIDEKYHIVPHPGVLGFILIPKK